LTYPETFRTNLATTMNRQGVTQSALAEKTGVSRVFILRILHGTQTPTLATAGKLADGVGLPLWKLLKD
jgi:transcriptional regulator with XRE-family HTH domain